jgi:hypothetical protein
MSARVPRILLTGARAPSSAAVRRSVPVTARPGKEDAIVDVHRVTRSARPGRGILRMLTLCHLEFGRPGVDSVVLKSACISSLVSMKPDTIAASPGAMRCRPRLKGPQTKAVPCAVEEEKRAAAQQERPPNAVPAHLSWLDEVMRLHVAKRKGSS